jgi:hypothetical protein
MPGIKITFTNSTERVFTNATACEDTALGHLWIYENDPTNLRVGGDERAYFNLGNISEWEVINN